MAEASPEKAPPEEAPRRPRRKTRRRVVLLVLGLVVVAWVAAAAMLGLQARRDLMAGISLVEQVRDDTGPDDLAAGRPAEPLRAARDRFERGNERLRSPILVPIRYMPVLGRQLRSVVALSRAATRISDVALVGVTEASEVLGAPSHSGPARVETLRRLASLAENTRGQLEGLDLGPSQALFGPLHRARQDLSDTLADVQEGLERSSVGARSAADMLAGPRRYLFFAANNAEMRAGSGMFLLVGQLETNAGETQLGPMRSVSEYVVPPGTVPLTGDLADRWGWLEPQEEWRNLMLSPRFDASAALAAEMWVAAGGAPVDGVMSLDAVALQGLLSAAGPVDVGGQRIDDRNVVEYLLHDQYAQFGPGIEDRAQRQDQLGAIANAVHARLREGGVSLPDLVSGLMNAARGRHVLAWSRHPSEQAGWRAAGVDGVLDAESLMVSVLSRTGNKLDRFLTVGAELDARATQAGTEVALTVTLDNTVPAGESPNVSGPFEGSGAGEGEYIGIVAVTLPGAATGGRFDGVPQLAVAGADGPTRVIAVPVSLRRGEQRTFTARFTLPGRGARIRVEPSARVPAVSWAKNGEKWADNSRHTLFAP